MQHAVAWLRDKQGYLPDYVMILQPTSPLRQSFHIREAVELAFRKNVDSVLAVVEIPEAFNPARSMRLNSGGTLELFHGAPLRRRIARRQDLPLSYWNTTLIYLFRPKFLFDPVEPNFFGEKVLPYVIDARYAIDINDPEDWKRAEEALKHLNI